jgi:membrane-bound serine protease (ClpP class)
MLLALAIAGLFFLPSPLNVALVAAAAFVEIGEVYFWIRFLRRYRVTTGAEGMVGEAGEVIAACDPEGRVRVRGEIWKARCEAGAGVGQRIVVRELDGLTLVVEPA